MLYINRSSKTCAISNLSVQKKKERKEEKRKLEVSLLRGPIFTYQVSWLASGVQTYHYARIATQGGIGSFLVYFRKKRMPFIFSQCSM